MHTTMTGLGWARAAGAVVGAILVAGCGGGSAVPPGGALPATPSAPAPAPTAFGKEAVRADLAAATAAAGLPGKTTSLSATPPASPYPAGPPATDRERARDEVVARMATCSVGWSSPTDPGSAQDRAEARKRFHAALAGLVERGWKESRPVEEVPVGKGSMVMAQYKKQDWTLHARHVESGLLDTATMTATEDACAARFTDAELNLLED
ncbi:hypothetical protein AVW11_10860 [Streptomyces amritsarensis]|uniref:Lipoprotein n=2 Tax=Streptomyces TaxID=1883 RepID=A0ABX3G8E5_9ACTN|nr:hypothetical protein [Streptomyces amritsarensis]OLZ69094.1 hypothetical protein AVW11_10860 [Streptomyces amritsarensis]